MDKSYSHLLVGFALVFCFTANSHAETLEEIYQQALKNDHQFKAAQAVYDAGKENKNIGRAGLLPQLNAEAGWTDSDSDETNRPFTLDDGTLTANPATVNSQSTSTGYTIALEQTLFNLSSWHTYKSGAAAAASAEARLKNAEQDLIIRTANAYFDALKAVDDLTTAKSEEDALKHQLEQTRQRFQVGLTAVTEVHEAQAAFDSATVNRLSAEGQLGIAFEALEVITGQPNDILSPLQSSFPVTNPTPADREKWVEFALENNHGLNAASWDAEAAESTAKARKSDHLPTVTASASIRDYETDNNNGLDNYINEDQAIGITLRVPLFTGGRTSASRRQASARSIEARENFMGVQRDVIQQTRSQHLAVVTGAASVKARAQAITSSQSALDATQAGYEVGTRDLVDVLNAQRNLFAAQRDYSTALYAYVISTLRLKEASGLLEPKDVTELSNWLDANSNVSRYQ